MGRGGAAVVKATFLMVAEGTTAMAFLAKMLATPAGRLALTAAKAPAGVAASLVVKTAAGLGSSIDSC